jgi:hypothetical protein
MTLKDFDKDYIKSLNETFIELEKSHDSILASYDFDLTKTEITEAIIERLKAYYSIQHLIKNFLEKRYLATASDFFVETVLFYLRIFLVKQRPDLTAHSERQIKKAKNAIRPDISIWKGDILIAIIECKTQLGWSRFVWEQQYNDRDNRLKTDYPDAKSYLLTMTSLNWGGFGENERLNKYYFSLLDNKTWPTSYSSTDQILTPIEKLFEQLTDQKPNESNACQ